MFVIVFRAKREASPSVCKLILITGFKCMILSDLLQISPIHV